METAQKTLKYNIATEHRQNKKVNEHSLDPSIWSFIPWIFLQRIKNSLFSLFVCVYRNNISSEQSSFCSMESCMENQ